MELLVIDVENFVGFVDQLLFSSKGFEVVNTGAYASV